MPQTFSDLTPMMNQYLEIKQAHKDAILFFRLGDFYEMFFEDAKAASAVLGLALTSREAGKNNRVPMCGIPYHAADNYITRLIKSDYKIAICEQVEDPKEAKGIVKRDIVRVITPATAIGQAAFSQTQNNYLVGLYQREEETFGFAVADLSTGEFKTTRIISLEKVLSEIFRIQPAEILLSAQAKDNGQLRARINARIKTMFSEVEDWAFDFNYSYRKLTAHFKTANLKGFGCEDLPEAVSAAGACLYYLENTQKNELLHINKLSVYSLSEFMIIDGIAQRNLELTQTMRGEKKATLLKELDFTSTAMGSRRLIQTIQQPLLDANRINARLDALEELFKNQLLRNKLKEELKNIVDMERLLSRLSLGIGSARDIFSLNQSLKIIPLIKILLKEIKGKELRAIEAGLLELKDLVDVIDRAVRPDAPLSIREGRMIRPGFNAELDGLLKITHGGKEWLAAMQEKEIKRSGISSLKIKYNKIFGYYIEITNANLGMVPPDYIRKQTLVNAERFITPELKDQEEKILSAEDKMIELEYRLFMEIRQKVLDNLSLIQKNAGLVAALDVFNSLAEAASRNRYVRPLIKDDDKIEIEEGRHPVVENLLDAGRFIPNDTVLDNLENQIAIITGPNMAGKSTYLRQTALIVLMAQMGSFVPAKKAAIGIVDRIFTRIGAGDDISAGMSTFMMEMSETANILNNATKRSLIILDEIGRGTSTFDRISIAWACVEYLNKLNAGKPKTLFATHYHELAELELMHKGVNNYNVAVREWNDEVTFLYKLVRGSADHSYGIYVARLAGLPKEVIQRAREILSNLEINSISQDGIPSLVKSDSLKKKKTEAQPDLFAPKENPVIKEMLGLDMNRLTPLEALNLINKWKGRLEEKKNE